MRFSTITASALFAAFAAASNETVTVENLSIRDNDGIVGASMTLQPANVECSSGDAAALSGFKTVSCGDTVYSFAVNGTASDYNIRLYKALGPAFGLYAQYDTVPVYCHAGGNGINDRVCSQVAPFEVVIVSA